MIGIDNLLRDIKVVNKRCMYVNVFGYGALPGKMLLVRIIGNNKIFAQFRSG